MRPGATFLVLLVLLGACSETPEPITTPPPPTASATTSTPSSTAASATPAPTQTPVPRPSVDPSVPVGTSTGIGAIDRVIEAVEQHDPAALAAVMRMTELPCGLGGDAFGIGGPPACGTVGGVPVNEGGIPILQGTLVESFPIGTCEMEWQPSAELVASFVADSPGTLYAVVTLDSVPDFFRPGIDLTATHALLYETAGFGEPGGILFAVEDGAITYIDITCFGPPALFFVNPLYGPLEIILRSPAFDG